MPKQWIVNPEIGLVSTLASYGRFLDNDYRISIEHMEVPSSFEEYNEKTYRKFVIIGAKSVPGATAKSVFLCLKLAGAASITVKAPTLDEYFMILNVIHYHNTQGVSIEVFSNTSEELRNDDKWNALLEDATDVVVFGGKETAEAFEDYENFSRRVWIHGPKFSFGVVRVHDLTPTVIKEICSDFYSFYGEGCLSPKFYVIVGETNQAIFDEFSGYMQAFYAQAIDEFRAKLPLTRRSELTQEFVSANYRGKYVREEKLNGSKIFTTLYGDARFVVVDDIEELDDFIEKWGLEISTVAANVEDEEIMDVLESNIVTRICNYGEMQFPDFFEQFDIVDDFDIYVGEVE